MDPELLRSMKMLILEVLQRPKHLKQVKQELREITERHTCRYTVYVMILGVYPPGQLATKLDAHQGESPNRPSQVVPSRSSHGRVTKPRGLSSFAQLAGGTSQDHSADLLIRG